MNTPVGLLNLSTIIERRLSFLLKNKIFPWDENDSSDLGEKDALQNMLVDSRALTEAEFEQKYLAEIAKFDERAEDKPWSIEDGDDYYESITNTYVSILEIINPINIYNLEE